MKKTNKKGFTIVELVIVIAVIAILAAILIPTFSSIIKKANIASDTTLAKNLNTVLAADESINGKPADFSAVLKILREEEYIVENLNPTTDGHFFVWESDSNQILLVDGKYKVVFSYKDLAEGKDTIGGTWFFAIKDASLIETIKTAGGSVIPAIDTNWIGTDGQKVTDVLKAGGVVTLNESITVTKAPAHANGNGKTDAIRLVGTKVKYNLAGQTMTVTNEFNTSFVNAAGDKTGYALIHAGKDSNVAIADGRIVASVKSTSNGLTLYGVVRAFDGGVVTVENMEIVYNGVADVVESGAVFTLGGPATLVVKDTAVTVSNSMGAEIAYGEATFENVNFKAAGAGAWNNICVAVSRGGTANLKSGTYIAATNGSESGCSVGVLTTGGTLNISGGTYEGKLFIGNDHAAGSTDSVINITGGTFNGIAFNNMSANDWAEIVSDPTAVITGVGTNNVVIKVAK